MHHNNNSYRDKFKKGVSDYEKITDSKYIQIIYDLEKNVLEKFFNKIKTENKSILDFACGSGRWTQYLESKFKTTTGVDISQEMINYAQKKCINTKFVVTDITSSANTLDEKYDVITAFRFYKNSENSLREDATKELEKYLNNDGYFIFDLHLNKFSFMGLLATIIKLLKINKLFKIAPITIKTVSLGEIDKILNNNNLKIVDYYGIGFLPSRSNYLIMPNKILYNLEKKISTNKLLRKYCYNILVFAKKIK